jgi:chromosome segregation ATPase
MRRHESVLRALRSQVQFEIVRAAAEVAQAARMTTRADRRVASLEQRAASFVAELRQVMGRARVNAALLDTMRRCHRAEQSELGTWQSRLRAAQRHEQQLRAALANLRNEERSLERALQAERRQHEQRLQALEMIRADELWLRHSMRESA